MQPILEPPLVTEISDTSATITWTEAFGDVDTYIIMYTRITVDGQFFVTIDSSVTSFTLTGLEALSEYSLLILTVNSDGDTAAGPAITFTTFDTFEPIDALLPFGTNFGDGTHPFTLDGATGPLTFNCRFYGTSEDTLYVSHVIDPPHVYTIKFPKTVLHVANWQALCILFMCSLNR